MLDENTYRSMNERIAPDAGLVESVRARARGEKAPKGPRMRVLRRVALAAALALCLCFAAPALAAGSPAVHRLVYAVSPALAQLFVPVRESCEDNGIRMEVVSTYVHGDTAEIYVTMQDLTGDRIDASIDLYDSYDLSIPFDSTGHCERVDYDPDTRTATFLVTVSTMRGEPIPGGKVSFSVRCFISGKQEALDVPLRVDWSQASTAPATQEVDYNGYSLRDYEGLRYEDIPDSGPALVPGEALLAPREGFEITAMGYIDGRLHVQLYVPGSYEFDDHAAIYWRDAAGEPQYGDSFSFSTRDTLGWQYEECIFDVAPEALDGLTLYGSFWSSSSRTDGNWKVTFPLKVSDGAG